MQKRWYKKYSAKKQKQFNPLTVVRVNKEGHDSHCVFLLCYKRKADHAKSPKLDWMLVHHMHGWRGPHLYSWAERGTVRAKVSCPKTLVTQLWKNGSFFLEVSSSGQGLNPGRPFNPQSSPLTVRLPCLPHHEKQFH